MRRSHSKNKLKSETSKVHEPKAHFGGIIGFMLDQLIRQNREMGLIPRWLSILPRSEWVVVEKRKYATKPV